MFILTPCSIRKPCKTMQLAVQSQFPSHADIRSAEILASVRQAFVDKGFDGASMQDLARAAGMSVGNFYRYFASKSAIIQALILQDAAQIRNDFAAIINSVDPMATLRRAIHDRISSSACVNNVGNSSASSSISLKNSVIMFLRSNMPRGYFKLILCKKKSIYALCACTR